MAASWKAKRMDAREMSLHCPLLLRMFDARSDTTAVQKSGHVVEVGEEAEDFDETRGGKVLVLVLMADEILDWPLGPGLMMVSEKALTARWLHRLMRTSHRESLDRILSDWKR